MNYLKVYNDLVEKARPRGLDKSEIEGYFEIHHIEPSCMGGSDEEYNLIMFTPREHVIAHKLLWKAYPENIKLMWAYTRTVTSHKEILTSRQVEVAKIAKSEYMRNRTISDETRNKISKTLTGHKRTAESIEKGRKATTGQKRSAATCKKLSDKRKELLASGWTHSEATRQRISETGKGRKLSPAVLEERSKRLKGKKLSNEIYIGLSAYRETLRPWEQSRVKAYPSRQFVWKSADYLFDLWKFLGEIGSWAFSTSYNKLHETSHATSHFTHLIKMFKGGWNPEEDTEWLVYRDTGVCK